MSVAPGDRLNSVGQPRMSERFAPPDGSSSQTEKEIQVKAVRFHQTGGPDVLVYEDVADPVAGPGEVLIKVEAAGINFADVMRRRGDYPERSPTPFTPGGEIAGTVVALGAGVIGPLIGTSVFSAIGVGGYAQFVAVPAQNVLPIPPGVDVLQASALVVQGLTAILMLRETARLRPGEIILVEAAAGGVGGLAVQLAKRLGAGKVIAAASTQAKRQLALDLGADAAIDYTKSDWAMKVKEATDGKGADVILEMAGGAVLKQALDGLAPFGRLIVYGAACGQATPIDLQRLLAPNQAIFGFYIGGYFARPDLIEASLDELIGHVAAGRVRLQVSHALPLVEASKAHRLLEGRATTGKLVLLPWANAS